MKKLVFLFAALAVLLSSCLGSSDNNTVIYCTSSEFVFTPSSDIFKFADVKVGEYLVNQGAVVELSAENPTFSDTVLVSSVWDEATVGYVVQLTKKDTSEIEKQAEYEVSYSYKHKLGQVYYSSYQYEQLKEDSHYGGVTYTYDELIANLDDIISSFNATHKYYYRWYKNGNGTYQVNEIDN